VDRILDQVDSILGHAQEVVDVADVVDVGDASDATDERDAVGS